MRGIRQKRKGFLLVWVAAAFCVILLLVGAVMAAFSETLRRQGMAEASLDGMHLLQENMETIKYNHVFHTSLPVTEGKRVRNGKAYQVQIRGGTEEAEGILMRRVVVEVKGPYQIKQTAELLLEMNPGSETGRD